MLDQFAVHPRLDRAGGELHDVGRRLVGRLCPGHVGEPGPRRPGVHQARAGRHDQLPVAHGPLALLTCVDPDGGDLADLGRDVDPFRPALPGGHARADRIGIVAHGLVEVVEAHRLGVEARVQVGREPGQRAEGAGGDHEPAARAKQRAECTDHPGGTEVVGVDQVADLLGVRNPGTDPGGGVGIHEVHAAVTIGDSPG